MRIICSKLYETFNVSNTEKQGEAALIGLESENQQLKEAVLKLYSSYGEEKKRLQSRVNGCCNY